MVGAETDWLGSSIAIYAAVVATGALFLEIRRWFESGPRIRLSMIPEARTTADIGLPDDEREDFVLLTVVNYGDSPITITNIVIYQYSGLYSYLRNNPEIAAIVPNNPPQEVPYTLGLAQIFHGKIHRTIDFKRMVETGWLFVGICASHREKPYLKRMPLPKKNKNAARALG